MPYRPRTPCAVPGCPELTAGGRCPEHRAQDKRIRDANGSAAYGTASWMRVRKAFIYANPWCVLCGGASVVADHYPLSRKALIAQGIDPDTPSRLRALCAPCHNRETARHQPGGWAAEHRKR